MRDRSSLTTLLVQSVLNGHNVGRTAFVRFLVFEALRSSAKVVRGERRSRLTPCSDSESKMSTRVFDLRVIAHCVGDDPEAGSGQDRSHLVERVG